MGIWVAIECIPFPKENPYGEKLEVKKGSLGMLTVARICVDISTHCKVGDIFDVKDLYIITYVNPFNKSELKYTVSIHPCKCLPIEEVHEEDYVRKHTFSIFGEVHLY